MAFMHYIITTLFYRPLYNALIFFISILPYHNVGVAVVLFTCIVKIILFPMSQKSIKAQFEMKKLEPEIAALKEKYKNDRQIQAEKTMELYKQRGINPLSGVLPMLIQLPVLMVLYYIFLRGGLPTIDTASIYAFTKIPTAVNLNLFGLSVFDKSTVYALFAALSQFLQMQITLPKTEKRPTDTSKTPEFKDELARSMNMQMKYMMPVVIFFIARGFPILVSLYLITSSLFAVGQELYIRGKNKVTI